MLRHPDPPLTDGVVTLWAKSRADVGALVEACSDPEIPRWTRVPSPYRAEHALQWLEASEGALREGTSIHWLVVDGEDALLASVGLVEIHAERGHAEIGYWVAAPARGRGVATRAVLLVRDWAHGELGLGTVEILANEDNLASRAVALRAGFEDTGEVRGAPREGVPEGRFAVYRSRAPSSA